jgi:hypothetical protein
MERNVDHDIEQFWLGFKTSMSNFYKSKCLNRPINVWSDRLNSLQSSRHYEDIEHCITKYISLYAIDLIRHNDSYNINILNTNIKRWDKISNKYKIFSNKNIYNKGCNLITTMLDIYTILYQKNKIDREIFDQLELFIFFGDFRSLIEYARDTVTPSIIDKLLSYDAGIFKQIKEIYDLDSSIVYPISAQKMFRHMGLQG